MALAPILWMNRRKTVVREMLPCTLISFHLRGRLGISLEHLFFKRISDGHDRLSLSACSTLSSKSFLVNGSKLKRQDRRVPARRKPGL